MAARSRQGQRPSTRRRNRVPQAYGQMRQRLVRSESVATAAAVPKASELALKAQASYAPEREPCPEGRMEVNFVIKEHELIDSPPEAEPNNVEEAKPPEEVNMVNVNARRVQHRVHVRPHQGPNEIRVPPPILPVQPSTSRRLLKSLINLRKIQIAHQRGEIEPKWKTNAVVKNTLRFSGKGSTLRGIITVKNTSQLNLTFSVKSSSLAKFEISPSIGWIRPLSEVKISVRTRPEFVQDFRNIASERFVVFTAPVYMEEQLEADKLETYWRVFGSEVFPSQIAESHSVDNFILNNQSDFSILGMVEIFCFRRKKDLEYNFAPAHPKAVHGIWELNETNWIHNMTMDSQYREFLRNHDLTKRSKQKIRLFGHGPIGVALKTGILIFASVLVVIALNAPTDENGQAFWITLMDALCGGWFSPICSYPLPPPPPPPAWYESLYFWEWF